MAQWGTGAGTINFPVSFTILAFGVTPPGTIAKGVNFHEAGGAMGIFDLTNVNFYSNGTGFWIAIGR